MTATDTTDRADHVCRCKSCRRPLYRADSRHRQRGRICEAKAQTLAERRNHDDQNNNEGAR